MPISIVEIDVLAKSEVNFDLKNVSIQVDRRIVRTDDSTSPSIVSTISSAPWNVTFSLHKNTDTDALEEPDLTVPLGIDQSTFLSDEQIAALRTLAGWGSR